MPCSSLIALDELDRVLARRAAGAVGHRDERRAERAQLVERAYRFASPASVFGGKNSNENTAPSAARIRSMRIDDYAVQRSGSPGTRVTSPTDSRWVR